MIHQGDDLPDSDEHSHLVHKLFEEADTVVERTAPQSPSINVKRMDESEIEDTEEIIEESLSLEEKEIELIQKASRNQYLHLAKIQLFLQQEFFAELFSPHKAKLF